MTASTPSPTRPRRFRFGLRTMFVLVTVASICLGWELALVRKRLILIVEIGDLKGIAAASADPYKYEDFINPPQSRLSFLRRALGDRWIGYVSIPVGTPTATIDRIRNAFPEATVQVEPEPTP